MKYLYSWKLNQQSGWSLFHVWYQECHVSESLVYPGCQEQRENILRRRSVSGCCGGCTRQSWSTHFIFILSGVRKTNLLIVTTNVLSRRIKSHVLRGELSSWTELEWMWHQIIALKRTNQSKSFFARNMTIIGRDKIEIIFQVRITLYLFSRNVIGYLHFNFTMVKLGFRFWTLNVIGHELKNHPYHNSHVISSNLLA